MTGSREPSGPGGLLGGAPHPAAPGGTRRLLARVLAVGALIVALALVVWARACAEADRCAEAGGQWDEEWKMCRQ